MHFNVYSLKLKQCFALLDLKIFSTRPDGVRATEEGDSVNLTCVNVCDKHSSAFIWFKNGEPINEGPVLYLNNVSSTNSGNYTCSLRRHTETSGVLNIDVECEYETQDGHRMSYY